jgi:hypothetical protein
MGGAMAVGGAAGSGVGGAGGNSGTGGASMAGEDCSSTLAASLGITSLDTTNLVNDYSSYSCGISTFQGLGPEAVLSVAVPGAQYLAAVHDNSYDGVIFGYDQCDPTIAAACVGGQDSLGELEGFTHQNTTVNSQTIYVFTDGWDSIDYGPVDVGLNVYDPAAGGDTCATAIPINKTAAQQVGGVSLTYSYQGFTADYDLPMTGCTMYTEPGLDVVFSIVLDTTDSLDVTLRPAGGNDTSVYLLVGNCTDPNAQCVAGADVGFSGDPEYITGYSPTANGTTVYIVVDGYLLSETDDAFLLNVTVQ